METNKDKCCWLTDIHLSFAFPSRYFDLIQKIKKANPEAVFLTGDISEGRVWFWLKQMAKNISCPIYFNLGNHCIYGSSFEETHSKVREVCAVYKNLIWMNDQNEPIRLSEEVALIGADGWYSGTYGNKNYLHYTLDWRFIKELKELKTLEIRIEKYKELANKSAELIKIRLEKALEQDYKTIYILTHFPNWKEAIRAEGTLLQNFWEPYNINDLMGKIIEEIMKNRNKKNVLVMCGHSHNPEFIRITRNINCQVGRPCDLFSVNSQTIFV